MSVYDLQQHTRHVAAGLAIGTAVLGVVAVGLPEHLYSYGLVDGQLTATNVGVFQVRSSSHRSLCGLLTGQYPRRCPSTAQWGLRLRSVWKEPVSPPRWKSTVPREIARQ